MKKTEKPVSSPKTVAVSMLKRRSAADSPLTPAPVGCTFINADGIVFEFRGKANKPGYVKVKMVGDNCGKADKKKIGEVFEWPEQMAAMFIDRQRNTPEVAWGAFICDDKVHPKVVKMVKKISDKGHVTWEMENRTLDTVFGSYTATSECYGRGTYGGHDLVYFVSYDRRQTGAYLAGAFAAAGAMSHLVSKHIAPKYDRPFHNSEHSLSAWDEQWNPKPPPKDDEDEFSEDE